MVVDWVTLTEDEWAALTAEQWAQMPLEDLSGAGSSLYPLLLNSDVPRAVQGQPIYVPYKAYNMASETYQTGDAMNHTLRWLKDGVETPVTNAPIETSHGSYAVLLTEAEATTTIGTLHGASSTPGVLIAPTTMTFDET